MQGCTGSNSASSSSQLCDPSKGLNLFVLQRSHLQNVDSVVRPPRDTPQSTWTGCLAHKEPPPRQPGCVGWGHTRGDPSFSLRSTPAFPGLTVVPQKDLYPQGAGRGARTGQPTAASGRSAAARRGAEPSALLSLPPRLPPSLLLPENLAASSSAAPPASRRRRRAAAAPTPPPPAHRPPARPAPVT